MPRRATARDRTRDGRCTGTSGSSPTRSIRTPPTPTSRRTAERAPGEAARRAPATTTRVAAASARARRRRRRRASRERTAPRRSGVGGNARPAPRSSSRRARSVTPRPPSRQRFPEPAERPREARLDRPHGDVERGGGLLLGEAEQVAARDDEALLLAEVGDGLEQPLALLREGELDVGEASPLRSTRPRTRRAARGAPASPSPAAGFAPRSPRSAAATAGTARRAGSARARGTP